MKILIALGSAAALALAGVSAFSTGTEPQSEEHSHDHSATAPAKVDAPSFDNQMKMMQEMHQKMMATKTPAERAALMKEHMEVMQKGMAMMGQMHGGAAAPASGMGKIEGGMPAQSEMMVRRMDMMESMMQMMMDRELGKLGDAHAHDQPGK